MSEKKQDPSNMKKSTENDDDTGLALATKNQTHWVVISIDSDERVPVEAQERPRNSSSLESSLMALFLHDKATDPNQFPDKESSIRTPTLLVRPRDDFVTGPSAYALSSVCESTFEHPPNIRAT